MGTHIEHITVLLFCNLPWPLNVIPSPSYTSAPRTPSHASSAHSPGAQTLPLTALAIPSLIRPFLTILPALYSPRKQLSNNL